MHQHTDEILDHLRHLVAFDSRNPPRSISSQSNLIAYVTEALGDGFEIEVADLGEGCVNVHARRGEPSVLFNVHLDTVPAGEEWNGDPFELRIEDGKATGLGACDIKGAAAGLLTAARHTDGPAAFLFSTDEETGTSHCVRTFAQNEHPYEAVIVAEPTQNRAVTAHRGLMTGTALFTGVGGHGSSERALNDNAIHHCVEWSAAAIHWARGEEKEAFGSLRGHRLNLGIIEGGIKPNMIADAAFVRFAMRPLPGRSMRDLFDELERLGPGPEKVSIRPGFDGPSLPASGPTGSVREREESARAFAGRLGLQLGEPVDFWSEAALFSEAGYDAIVFGPGSIEQAHTADEWIAVSELERYVETLIRLLS